MLEKTLKYLLKTAFKPLKNDFVGLMLNTTVAGIQPQSVVKIKVTIKTKYITNIIGKNTCIKPLKVVKYKIQYAPSTNKTTKGNVIRVLHIE